MSPGDFTRIRRKLSAGADLVTDFRFARLFHDGGALWVAADPHVMWFRLTKAIAVERGLCDRDHWAFDQNRLWGLHQARVWLRRNWKRLEARKARAA